MISQFLWKRIGLPGAVICATWFLGCESLPNRSTGNQNVLLPVNTSTVMLSLDPGSKTVATGEVVTFTSPFSSVWSIEWSVNGVSGGNSVLGSVDSTGRYTAPLLPPTQTVTLTASLPDASEDPGALTATARVTIVNPAPTINEISPNAIPVGSQQTGMTILGTGFNPASIVTVNGQSISTIFVGAQQLTANLPASMVGAASELSAIVSNPAPGGGDSAAQNIMVVNPIPVVGEISPQTINAGSTDLTLTLSGSGFLTNSHVSLGGQLLTSKLVNPSTLSVVLPGSDLASGGTLSFAVTNDSPGGGASISPVLTVLNPPPIVTSVSPQVFFSGAGPASITLSGSGFVPASSITISGQQLPITYVSSGQVQVAVPNSLLVADSLPIVVSNSAPGGGVSSPQILTVLENGQVMTTGNPQVASYLVTIPDGSQAKVEFGEQDYSFTTSAVAPPSGGGQARVLVAGMKSNTGYHMRAAVHLSDGTSVEDVDHVFTTGGLPSDQIPQVNITRTGIGVESPGIQLLDSFFPTNGRLSFAVFDRDGNLIWYYANALTETYFPGKLLDSGNFLLNVNGTSVREINLAGESQKTFTVADVAASLQNAGYSFPLGNFHHDILKLPNGHYILLAYVVEQVLLTGSTTPQQVIGDVLLDVDPTLNVVWVWNAFDHLDVNRHPVDETDWTHSNALVYLPQDGNLLLSMRHQSWVLKIDYRDGTGTGNIIWRLGYQGDFSMSGNDPEDWFYLQHYPNPLSYDGTHMRLALFDNGDNRILDQQGDECGTVGQIPCYSRALILDLDEQAMTASTEFGSNLGLYSFWGGSAQVAANGNFLAGITTTSTGSRAEEITTDSSSQVVWQMDILGQNAYRSLRLPSLYPGIRWP